MGFQGKLSLVSWPLGLFQGAGGRSCPVNGKLNHGIALFLPYCVGQKSVMEPRQRARAVKLTFRWGGTSSHSRRVLSMRDIIVMVFDI